MYEYFNVNDKNAIILEYFNNVHFGPSHLLSLKNQVQSSVIYGLFLASPLHVSVFIDHHQRVISLFTSVLLSNFKEFIKILTKVFLPICNYCKHRYQN
jgi:hypothetical protein